MLRNITNPYLYGWHYTCIAKHFSIAVHATTYKRILAGYLSGKTYENVLSITGVKSAHSVLIRCSGSSETALFSIVRSNHPLYAGLNWELHALCWVTKRKKNQDDCINCHLQLEWQKEIQNLTPSLHLDSFPTIFSSAVSKNPLSKIDSLQ